MEKFTFFWNGPFSQWHKCSFKVDGVEYNCAEQYMMAEKARMFEGPELFVKDENGNVVKDDKGREIRTTLGQIMEATHPGKQKALGRQVKNFDEEKWNAVAKDVVYRGNYAKFTFNGDLMDVLMKTRGTTLVEASPYDCIWGIGLAEDDPLARNRDHWRGTNWLGEVLTKLREDLFEKGCLVVGDHYMKNHARWCRANRHKTRTVEEFLNKE